MAIGMCVSGAVFGNFGEGVVMIVRRIDCYDVACNRINSRIHSIPLGDVSDIILATLEDNCRCAFEKLQDFVHFVVRDLENSVYPLLSVSAAVVMGAGNKSVGH